MTQNQVQHELPKITYDQISQQPFSIFSGLLAVPMHEQVHLVGVVLLIVLTTQRQQATVPFGGGWNPTYKPCDFRSSLGHCFPHKTPQNE